jgi:hypothetical protein
MQPKERSGGKRFSTGGRDVALRLPVVRIGDDVAWVNRPPQLFPEPVDLASVQASLPPLECIGHSGQGRPIGLARLGRGPLQAVLVAGAHAEEPAGPAFLRALIAILSDPNHPDYGKLVLSESAGKWAGQHVLEAFTLHIVPHMNPDGEAAAVSAGWLDPMPGKGGYFCPAAWDFQRLSTREKPGQDVEFGWPWSSEELSAPSDAHPVPHVPPTSAALRTENAAVAEYLLTALSRPMDPGRPLVFHGSLHGMAYATGAWCLVGRGWTRHRTKGGNEGRPYAEMQPACGAVEVAPDRSAALRAAVASAVLERGMPLHDMDRAGEKGFDRIGPGFATTPDVWAMRNHFLGLTPPDAEMAAKFRPSSMDFARGLGVDPLLMVSEVPMFLLYGDQGPVRRNHQCVVLDQGGLIALEQISCDPPGDSVLDRFRKRLGAEDAEVDSNGIPTWVREFRVVPVPASLQVGMVGDMVLAGLACAAGQAQV